MKYVTDKISTYSSILKPKILWNSILIGKTQIDSAKTQWIFFPKLSFSEIACNQLYQKSGEKKSLSISHDLYSEEYTVGQNYL